jgi:hypothetical protein
VGDVDVAVFLLRFLSLPRFACFFGRWVTMVPISYRRNPQDYISFPKKSFPVKRPSLAGLKLPFRYLLWFSMAFRWFCPGQALVFYMEKNCQKQGLGQRRRVLTFSRLPGQG